MTEDPKPTGPKRFYDEAAAAPAENGDWTVHLDGRPLKTPGKALFLAPLAVAEAAAAEWASQAERVEPLSMPVTRAVCTAIERIAPQREAVVNDIAAYGAADLLCYRAEEPDELIAREAGAWDPLLAWAADDLAAPLQVVHGVIHEAQPPQSLAALRDAVAAHTDLGLAALHELTTLSGSVVIALAVARERLEPDAAWANSRVDELFQTEKWGEDAEAAAAAAKKEADFLAAARLLAMVRS